MRSQDSTDDRLNDLIRRLSSEVSHNPLNADAYYNLGVAFHTKGLTEKAMTCYRKSLSVNPLKSNAYINLSVIHANRGEVLEGIRILEEAIKIVPDSAALYDSLGEMLLTAGDDDRAVPCLAMAIDLQPGNADAYYHLGSIHERKGNFDEAIRIYLNGIRSACSDQSFIPLYSDIAQDYLAYREKFSGIKGFLGDLEGYTLMMLASKGPAEGEIVEIGSYMGRSTCWLATGAEQACREKVTAVDHFTGSTEHRADGPYKENVLFEEGTTFNKFMNNIRGLGLDNYVTPIIASSEEAIKNWSRPVRLLFIDGEHSYEESKKDFSLWSPFVVKGGCIAFHDIGVREGVTFFYDELMRDTIEYKPILPVMSTRVIQKL